MVVQPSTHMYGSVPEGHVGMLLRTSSCIRSSVLVGASPFSIKAS